MECAICLEPCNKSTRKDSTCLFCSAIFCRKCIQETLLHEESLEIHCPGCKAIWNRDFIDTICTLTFRTGAFKAHREKILLDSERIRLPDTQEEATQYQLAKKFINRYESKLEIVTLKLEEQTVYKLLTEVNSLLRELYNFKISELNVIYNDHFANIEKNHHGRYASCTMCNVAQSSLNEKYAPLRRRLMTLHRHYTAMSSEEFILAERYKKILRSEKALQMRRLIQFYGIDMSGAPHEKRAFIKACPVTDCRGFLSTQWKCGICNIKVCKDCHDPVVSELHRCEPDKVASVKMIAAETRSCPKCATVIFKFAGCDQMFCIECKTAFSWTTGAVETGHIHNPHYYDWMRKNGLPIPRAPVGVLVCEMDDATVIRQISRRSHATVPSTMDQALCKIIYDRYTQIQHHEFILRRLRAHIAQPPPHKDRKRILRVCYLINEISEIDWKIELQKQEKHQHVMQSRAHIVEMHLAAFRDILNTFIRSTPVEIIIQLNQLLLFTIEQYKIMNMRIQSKADIKTYIPMWEDSMWSPTDGVLILPLLEPAPPPVAPAPP
jgi:hypothetical protein